MTDVFSTIEDIKDAYIVDTLYGKYIEAIFNPPIVLVFTNERLDEHKSKLSADRWLRLHINSNFSIEFRKDNGDGTITPLSLDELNIKKLIERANDSSIKEIILALSATVDGQTTAHYVADCLVDSDVEVSRLGHGVPVGGELDYMDEGTIAAALTSRQKI